METDRINAYICIKIRLKKASKELKMSFHTFKLNIVKIIIL